MFSNKVLVKSGTHNDETRVEVCHFESGVVPFRRSSDKKGISSFFPRFQKSFKISFSMKNSLSFDWCNMKFYELKRRKQHSGAGRALGGGAATGGATSPTSTHRSSSLSSTSSSCSLSPSPTPSTPCKDKEIDPVVVVVTPAEEATTNAKGRNNENLF